jgi:hypothetical protein
MFVVGATVLCCAECTDPEEVNKGVMFDSALPRVGTALLGVGSILPGAAVLSIVEASTPKSISTTSCAGISCDYSPERDADVGEVVPEESRKLYITSCP